MNLVDYGHESACDETEHAPDQGRRDAELEHGEPSGAQAADQTDEQPDERSDGAGQQRHLGARSRQFDTDDGAPVGICEACDRILSAADFKTQSPLFPGVDPCLYETGAVQISVDDA